MNVETIKSRLTQVTEEHYRAATGFCVDTWVSAAGLYFSSVFYLIGRYYPEENPLAVAAITLSVAAGGSAIYRARQSLSLGTERRRLWAEKYLPSSRSLN